MSSEQPYFPPKGTKYKWSPKALNYSPWAARIETQLFGKLYVSRLSACCYVDLKNYKYNWRVECTGFDYKLETITGQTVSPLKACKAAESAAEKFLKQQTPWWVIKALKAGWRPPGVPEIKYY